MKDAIRIKNKMMNNKRYVKPWAHSSKIRIINMITGDISKRMELKNKIK